MLTIESPGASATCDGFSRRDFLRVGSLALGSLDLPWLLANRARAASSPGFVKPKSIVLLFCSGGASHIETFDPKPDAPQGVRSVTGNVATALPGVTFGGTFPQLASLANKLAVVRSFQHPIGGHEEAIVHVLTGGTNRKGKGTDGFSVGSAVSRLRGTNDARTGLPTYALLTSDEVDGQYRSERGRVAKGSAPGILGMPYAPFDPSAGGAALANMKLGIRPERLADRRALLQSLDRLERRFDASGAMEGVERFEQQAFDVILRGASAAFDLTREDPRTLERYDTSMFQVGHKKFRPSALGHHLLLARRLCEAGCGFVTVHSAGWDMHADGNNPGIAGGMQMLGRPLDKAVSAFIEDTAARGLDDEILLVITGDFGRTPKVNQRGGRDHWANLCTLAFAGGGLKMGQVIGHSTRTADRPLGEPIGMPNVLATLMHALFDMSELRVARGIPSDITRAVTADRIEALF